MVQTKIATLLRAYKAAADNERQTGSAPCVTPFMDIMDDLFGNRPIISNRHTLNMGGSPIQPLPDDIGDIVGDDISEADFSGFERQINNSTATAPTSFNVSGVASCSSNANANPTRTDTPTRDHVTSFRRKKNVKETIFEKRMEWEREKLDRKENIILKIETARQKRHEENKKKLDEIVRNLRQ